MARYAFHRILLGIPTLIGITLVTFMVIRFAPGDPASMQAGDLATSGDVQRLRELYGLDQPMWKQYLQWTGRLATLDFGQSFIDGRPVGEKLRERAPATLCLAGGALLLSLPISIWIGRRSARKHNGPFDVTSSAILYGIYATPRYVLAMLLIGIFCVWLKWLPLQGMSSPELEDASLLTKTIDIGKHSILIIICFAAPLIAYQSRLIRASILEAMSQDYIRTARAKGLDEKTVVNRHAFGNALLPLATHLGLALPALIGGSVILETMFNWPGMGRLFFQAIAQRDYPSIMAISTLSAVLVLAGTLAVDLLYAWLDPRIRYTNG